MSLAGGRSAPVARGSRGFVRGLHGRSGWLGRGLQPELGAGLPGPVAEPTVHFQAVCQVSTTQLVPAELGWAAAREAAASRTARAPLRTDYIDVYWIDMWDRHTTAEESMRPSTIRCAPGKFSLTVKPGVRVVPE